MAYLEPPTRPHSIHQLDSARTSKTHLEMTEAGISTGVLVPRPTESTSHEPHLQPDLTVQPGGETKDVMGLQEGTAGEAQVPQTPQVFITFLVISGRRKTMSFEPETTLGRLKELVWNSWPPEWEDERPMAPSYLRVLYLGKMLQDDDTLTTLKFPTHTPQPGPAPTPTIVHLSIRPYAPASDSDLKKKRKSIRAADANTHISNATGEESSSAGCCGCIIC